MNSVRILDAQTDIVSIFLVVVWFVVDVQLEMFVAENWMMIKISTSAVYNPIRTLDECRVRYGLRFTSGTLSPPS